VLDDFSYFLEPGGILYCGFQEGEPQEGYFSNLLEDEREVFLTIVSEEGIKEVLREKDFEVEFAEKYKPAEDEVQFKKLHIIARRV
jgi:DNA-dependent RNA polymerase auxiliary subunit epsilon